MRYSLFILFFGIVGVVLQGSVLKLLSPFMIVPDFLVILVIYTAFNVPSSSGAVLSFLLGLEFDIFASRTLLGPYAASSVVVFTASALLSQRVFFHSHATVILTAFFSCLLNQVIYALMALQFLDVKFVFAGGIKTWLVQGVFTAAVAPFIFVLLGRVMQAAGKGEHGREFPAGSRR